MDFMIRGTPYNNTTEMMALSKPLLLVYKMVLSIFFPKTPYHGLE